VLTVADGYAVSIAGRRAWGCVILLPALDTSRAQDAAKGGA
jgi:hypothetical protein